MTVSLTGLSELNNLQARSLCRFLLRRIRPVCEEQLAEFIEKIDLVETQLLRGGSARVPSSGVLFSEQVKEFILAQQGTENEEFENLLRAVWEAAKYSESENLRDLKGVCISLFDFVEDRIKDMIYGEEEMEADRDTALRNYQLVYISPIYLGEQQLLTKMIEKARDGTVEVALGNQLPVSLYYLRRQL